MDGNRFVGVAGAATFLLSFFTAPAAAQVNPPEAAIPAQPGPRSNEIVLSPEGNRLKAYDTGSLEMQVLIPSVGDALGSPDIPDADGRDINGQICVQRSTIDGTSRLRFISGEDSQDDDGQRPGWGYFELTGSVIGSLAAEQIGKLDPADYLGAPDNFGCGFLSDGRLVTTAIGDTLPGETANGELILWFPDEDGGFTQGFTKGTSSGGGTFTDGTVPYCKLDVTLATAGGIWVDSDDNVYVATNRPDDDGRGGGVFRFGGALPTAPDEAGGCGGVTSTGEPFVDEGRITKTLLVPNVPGLPLSPFALTPSSVAGSGRTLLGQETFYVSSVFTGTIAEFLADGTFLRYVLVPPGPVPVGQVTGVTPFGLAVSSDGTLYVADLGIVVAFPVGGAGSVLRVPFLDSGAPEVPVLPMLPEQIADGLTYPDGLGITKLE